MFSSLKASSKKHDSDVISASSAASRSSESKGRAHSFSLSRLLPSRRRSKSRLSLDSELSRSDTSGANVGVTGCRSPSPYNQMAGGGAGAMAAAPSLNLSNVQQLGVSTSSIGGRSGDQVPQGPHFQWSLRHNAAAPGFGSSLAAASSVPSPVMARMSSFSKEELEKKDSNLLECPVCLVDKTRDQFLEISTCHHRCCSKCLKEYFKIEIMESRVSIACPECSELFHPNDIAAIIQDDSLMQKYEDFMLRRVLAMDSDTRWCPAPDCGYAVVAAGCAGCPKLKCEREGCGTFFCYHCKQYWHPNQTCDAARAERSPNIRSASISYSQESGGQNEIKSCPRCGAFIVKMNDGSCNHMTCPVCEAAFCWLCMKEISDLHYLSPSGCTFWGRKPWSRKKKILWQLGTLVGAPVGITLVAGIAVPAMIVGIPVWVGRKIHYRLDKSSKHKRRLAISGGVLASILAAPVVAGLAVGIGVPILLVYVYGVVPFSLCRSGGCGVTTTNSGGVRFEFDEDNENPTHGPYSYTGDNHSIETAPNVANPSIAPSIGDASLGMTNSLSASGSHMERAGIIRDDSDRDSSSHRAINGSLCSGTYATQHHKLEVHADISEQTGQQHQQGEMSSMGGLSLNDDASTRALAGSIISPKDKDGISVCSRHLDNAGGPNHYPEESKEDHSTSSCPTSPQLRKASPAPSEDMRSFKGKKCTRFMDQVSEIESKESDCLSMASVLSTDSNTPSMDASRVRPATPPSAAPVVPTSATMTSCESLVNDTPGALSSFGAACRLKAESTSVLVDGAESRRCEMAGGVRRKSESGYGRPDHHGSMGSRKKGFKPVDKEHRSQPGNLCDISELRGMTTVHAAGCSDLLAVVDTSSESVFGFTSSASMEESMNYYPSSMGSLSKDHCEDIGYKTQARIAKDKEKSCNWIDGCGATASLAPPEALGLNAYQLRSTVSLSEDRAPGRGERPRFLSEREMSCPESESVARRDSESAACLPRSASSTSASSYQGVCVRPEEPEVLLPECILGMGPSGSGQLLSSIPSSTEDMPGSVKDAAETLPAVPYKNKMNLVPSTAGLEVLGKQEEHARTVQSPELGKSKDCSVSHTSIGVGECKLLCPLPEVEGPPHLTAGPSSSPCSSSSPTLSGQAVSAASLRNTGEEAHSKEPCLIMTSGGGSRAMGQPEKNDL